jgi:hypothetical protein
VKDIQPVTQLGGDSKSLNCLFQGALRHRRRLPVTVNGVTPTDRKLLLIQTSILTTSHFTADWN